MANKKSWFFGGRNTKKDSKQDETIKNELEINNLTPEMLNISLEVNNLTASALNLSLEVNDINNPQPSKDAQQNKLPTSNANTVQLGIVDSGESSNNVQSQEVHEEEPIEENNTVNNIQATSNINVIQLDTESIVNGNQIFTERSKRLAKNAPKEYESYKEVTYDYVPIEFRYTSAFSDSITINNVTYKIIDDYGETNGLRIYVIKSSNAIYKFMWYSKKRFKNYDLAEETLAYVLEHPTIKETAFIPKEILKTDDGFGYIMAFVSKEYHTLRSIVENYSKFNKVSTIENTAINLIKTFKSLDSYGLYLYNFDEKNMLINTLTGEVFLDVISGFTTSSMLKHTVTYEYLAPETNIGGILNTQSTLHSLMVILFKLIYHEHPLEGHNVVSDVNLISSKEWYAKKALFNMSSVDTSNHPVRGVHYQLISLWNKYPNYIKNVFCHFFEDALFNPLDRYDYDNIMLAFKHLKIMTFSCSCGSSDFLQNVNFNGTSFQCSKCGKDIEYLYFDNTKRSIPIKPDSTLYLSFVTKTYDSDLKIGVIIKNSEDNTYGLKNLTDIPWNYSSANDVDKIIEPNAIASLVSETIIDIGYTRILVNSTKF